MIADRKQQFWLFVPARSFARYWWLAALTIFWFSVASNAAASENIVSANMVGHWTGNARIIVVWCQQTNLPVSIRIQPNGSVTGTVGDATLTNARLKANRGWLGRKLRLKTDYLITGKLSGPIIQHEQITRSGVSIPLNFTGSAFVGGVHTSGSHVGGKDRMILSAQGLTLARTNTP